MNPWFCRPKVLVIYEKWSPFWMNLFWQLRRLTILWVLNAYDHKFFNKGYILEINRYCLEIWSSNTWVDHLCSLVTHQCFSWVNDSGPQSLWVRIIAVPVIVPPGSFGMQLFAGHVISVFCSAVCSLSRLDTHCIYYIYCTIVSHLLSPDFSTLGPQFKDYLWGREHMVFLSF